MNSNSVNLQKKIKGKHTMHMFMHVCKCMCMQIQSDSYTFDFVMCRLSTVTLIVENIHQLLLIF